MGEHIKLRPYQQLLYDEIYSNLSVGRLLVQAECGFGKSILIGRLANELSKQGRVLILTHRVELLIQNHEWLENASILTSKYNNLRYDSKIVISMVETINARIKTYGIKYLGDFETILCDEAHLDYFKKVYDQYNPKRLIGFTATPMTNKRESKIVDGVEYARPLTMAAEYDKLICGIGTQELVDLGYLNQDYNIVLTLPDIDKLKASDTAPDGFTKASINEVYNNTASLEVLYKGYELYGKRKKTMVFNANSGINLAVYEYFSNKNVNCKLFDSVNQSDMNRNEIVEWFNNTPDAVLINANIFLIGFNVPDVETILFNRATKSLALYLQAAGRGARITNKIYKDKFTFVDLGQNILEHGTFSQKRDWQQHFNPAEWKRKVATDLLKTWECTYCGALNIVGEENCCVCGMLKLDVEIVENGKKQKTGEFEALTDMPLPKAKSIIDYTVAKNKDSNFAFKLLEQRIIDLFIHYNVTKTFYEKRRYDFHVRIKQIYLPIYFAIIKSDKITGAHKRIETQLTKLYSKIDNLYRI